MTTIHSPTIVQLVNLHQALERAISDVQMAQPSTMSGRSEALEAARVAFRDGFMDYTIALLSAPAAPVAVMNAGELPFKDVAWRWLKKTRRDGETPTDVDGESMNGPVNVGGALFEIGQAVIYNGLSYRLTRIVRRHDGSIKFFGHSPAIGSFGNIDGRHLTPTRGPVL